MTMLALPGAAAAQASANVTGEVLTFGAASA
jgi:hypothetical protein